ncbi:unnamed protein product [Somion occarium]|uniref:Uncharacterized protein n=1 Tax=Somion occarium TaxID=3059160 RepID=A0ABP1D6W1_9APHY
MNRSECNSTNYQSIRGPVIRPVQDDIAFLHAKCISGTCWTCGSIFGRAFVLPPSTMYFAILPWGAIVGFLFVALSESVCRADSNSESSLSGHPYTGTGDWLRATRIDELLHYTSIFGDAKQQILGTVHRRLEHSDFDFWSKAESIGIKLQTYTENLLKEAASQVSLASERTEAVKRTMHTLVAVAADFESDVIAHTTDGTSLAIISEDFDNAFVPIIGELHKIFTSSNEAPTHDERNRTVHDILERVQWAIVRVGIQHGMKEELLNTHVNEIRPQVERLVVLIGDLSEQYPAL